MKNTLLLLAFTFGMTTAATRAASAQTMPVVIRNCNNPDIGNTNIFSTPVVITWNPCLAVQADAVSPGASAFFFAHEMCHASLRTPSEPMADRCAAAQVGPAVAAAAVRYFLTVAPTYPYLPAYGTAYDRANRIAEAAGLPRP
jgi:hypothetical protein